MKNFLYVRKSSGAAAGAAVGAAAMDRGIQPCRGESPALSTIP